MRWIQSVPRSALVGVALFTLLPALNPSARAQGTPPAGQILPVVSIRATTAQTLEAGPTVDPVPGVFTIARQGDTNEALLLLLRFTGTATYGQDYQSLDAWQTLPPGQNSLELRVHARWDGLLEGDETLIASLVFPPPGVTPIPNYTIDPQHTQATVVIHDFDRTNDIPIVSLEVLQKDAAETLPTQNAIIWAEFQVVRTGDLSHELVAFLGPPEGTAHFGEDYRLEGVSSTLSVRFPAGARTVNVRLYPIDDQLVEGDETALLHLIPPPAGTPTPVPHYQVDQAHAAITLVIHDNDGVEGPTVRIDATQPIAEETSAPLRRLPLRGQFTLSRNGATDQSLSVFVHYSGTAIPGVDYPPLPFLVTFPIGASSVALEVEPIDDGIPEGIETLLATLSYCPPDTDPALGIPCHNGFTIDPVHGQATVLLRDDGVTTASVVITNPKEGASFPVGQPISIQATAIDLDSYISRVEFWDGDHQIGVSEIVFVRAPDPGTPIEHSFEWHDAAPGQHVLTARADVNGAIVQSQPVTITVGPAADRVVLEIAATDAVATEPLLGAANIDPAVGVIANIDPAVFTIRRLAGPLDLDVAVFYSVGGTAQNGIDYAQLPGHILLPSGAASVRLVVNPLPDKVLEGDETILIRLEPPICIAIFPPPPDCYEIGTNAEAHAILHDREPNELPDVAITKPADGTAFPLNTDIEIVAAVRDPDGYVPKVEFFANRRKIGEVNVEFIRPPDPGQPQTFSFVWHDAPVGRYALTARATDDRGAIRESAPVGISVGAEELLPVVTVRAPDAFAVEPSATGGLNTATFRIRRSGPTNEDLVVAFALLGTAENGIDYETIPSLATIPAGHRGVEVVVRPRADDLKEGIETVVLRLAEPPPASPEIRVINPYRVGRPGAAVALISDEPWLHGPDAAQCAALPGRWVHVCFAAEDGHNFRVEASPNLRDWETLQDGPSADGAWHFVDSADIDRPQRFYRLALEPVLDELP